MDSKAILDNLFNASKTIGESGKQAASRAIDAGGSGKGQAALLGGLGAAGAVALFFGSKGTRKFAKKALTVGGTAAVGGLAYKAYSEWKTQSAEREQFDIGTPIDALPSAGARQRSEAIVQAMISAARADGHIDELELQRITAQLESAGFEQDVSRFLLAEIGKPLDPERIAALADSPEAAAEIYLVSAMFIDNEVAQERNYLNSLAEAMGLDAQVTAQIESQLDGVSAS